MAVDGIRRAHEDYGAKKIIWFLERHRPDLALPSRTTVHNILLRHDLVPKRRKRLRRWHPGRPDTFAEHPNDTWSADFKGEFPTLDGALCYPLTVQDMHSRFVLDCRGRPNVKTVGVFPVFTRLFRELGLPRRIRTDNGTPFATNTLGRLSRLTVWFVQIGIQPQLIEPGCPQQNGKHENMHLVLKRQATLDPRAPTFAASSAPSTTSAPNTTTSGPTRPSTVPYRPTSMNCHLGPTRRRFRPSPIRVTSRPASSATTEASAGTPTASSSVL